MTLTDQTSCDPAINLVKYFPTPGGNERRPKGDAFGKAKLSKRGKKCRVKCRSANLGRLQSLEVKCS